jgi:chromosome partitioning protein
MSFENDIFLSQRNISELCGISLWTVNKFVTTHTIPHNENTGGKIKRYSIQNTRKIIYNLLSSEKKIQKKVHVFYNFKGGTGKTSLCYQTCTHLALMGFRVLAIDLDPQGHLSRSLRCEENGNYATMYDVIFNGEKIENVIRSVFPGLDVVPSNLALTRIEVPLSQRTRREEVLRKILDTIVDSYDFVLIDTNPTISVLNMNALVAADHINVVCETHPYSLAGLGLLVEELEKFFHDMQLMLSYKIVANKYEAKTATAQEVLGVLRLDYKNAIMETVVRKSEDINLSTKKSLPVCCVGSNKSTAFEDIRDFIHELINKSVNQ